MKKKIEKVKEQSENSDLNKKFEDFSYPVDDTNWDNISSRIPSGNGGGFLSENFAAHSVVPSAGVWRGIKASIKPSSRKRIAAWWWYGAAAAVFLFGYLGFLQFSNPENQSGIAVKQTQTIIDQKKDSEIAKESTKSIEPESNNPVSSSTSAKANTTKSETTNQVERDNTISIPNDSQSERTTQSPKFDKQITGRETELAIAEIREVNENFSSMPSRDERMTPMKMIGIAPEIDNSVITAAFLAGEIIPVEPTTLSEDTKKQKSSPFYDGTETPTDNQFALLAGSQLAFAGNGKIDMAESNNYDISSGISPTEENFFDENTVPVSVNYSTPIYYGVNGEIKFWKRLSAGLGLGYLRMQTTANYNNGLQSKVEDKEQKYLSIPVYLKFNFIDKPKFTAYTTAGNSLDLLVWQKVTTTETSLNGPPIESCCGGEDEKGNQANLYAGLGISFKFTKHLGVFAEGSLMRYYSITGTNFYSQQNLWPGMRFGILVSF